MSFNIGQLRRNNISSYHTPLSYTVDNIKTTSETSKAIIFNDKVIKLRGNNILQSGQSYTLTFSVTPMNRYIQKIKVYLKYSGAMEDNIQNLQVYTIEDGSSDFPVTNQLIISPNGTYDQIVFELLRLTEDYSIKNNDGTYGRIIDLRVNELNLLKNIISELGISTLKKIGIQSRPGMLFCLNGEQIRVGNSGIYELAFEVDIDSIGFVVSDEDFFIMDYQY